MAEFDVKCSYCGSFVKAVFVNSVLEVEPCEDCLDERHDDGYRCGYQEGYEDRDEEEE